jgi:hypothetical protein
MSANSMLPPQDATERPDSREQDAGTALNKLSECHNWSASLKA